MKLKFYEHIDDMPVYNWFKIHATNDYSFMLVKRRTINEKEELLLREKFNTLYDQYIEMFGFNRDYIEILEKKKKIALLMIKKAEKNDRSLNTIIKLNQLQLMNMEARIPPTSNFYEIKAHVEKKLKFQINIREMSVSEFFHTLKSVK